MKRLIALTVGIALIAPASALASGSTCKTYNPQLCSVVGNTTANRGTGTGTGSGSGSGTGQSSTQANQASTLPFTGIDVALLVMGGAALLGGGLVVRRLSRPLE